MNYLMKTMLIVSLASSQALIGIAQGSESSLVSPPAAHAAIAVTTTVEPMHDSHERTAASYGCWVVYVWAYGAWREVDTFRTRRAAERCCYDLECKGYTATIRYYPD